MVLLLTQVLNRTAGAWTAGQAQTERRQSARAMADSIAQELSTALLPLDPADKTGMQFCVNPQSVPNNNQYRNPDVVFWQAPIATDRSLGDVAEVGYFLKWDTQTNPGNPRPLFCRFFVNPSVTKKQTNQPDLILPDDNYLIVKTPGAWLNNTILEKVAPAVATGTDRYRGLFAENVVGFWVRCYDKDQKLIAPYDSRVTKTLPTTVKVFLVMVDNGTLSKLHSIPDYNVPEISDPENRPIPDLEKFITSLPDGIRQTARSFTSEVRLQNAL